MSEPKTTQNVSSGEEDEIRVITHEPAKEAPRKALEGEELTTAIRSKVSYYLSKENLQTDAFLVSKMTNDMWVEVAVIAQFRAMLTIGATEASIVEAVKGLDAVVLSSDGKQLKPNIKVERKTLIIRDIAQDADKDEVAAIFADLTGDMAPVELRSEVGNNLFVTFASEAACLNAHGTLSSRTFRDKTIRGRVKSETLVKSFYQPAVPVQPFVYPQYYNGNGQYGGMSRGGQRGNRGREGRKKDGERGKKGQGRGKRGSQAQQQFQLGMQNFPPLPNNPGQETGATCGYGTTEYRRFEMSELLAVLDTSSAAIAKARPAFITEHELVVAEKANVEKASEPALTWEDSTQIFAQVDQTPLGQHSPFVSPMFVAVQSQDYPGEMFLGPAATSYAHVTQKASTPKTRTATMRVPANKTKNAPSTSALTITPPTPDKPAAAKNGEATEPEGEKPAEASKEEEAKGGEAKAAEAKAADAKPASSSFKDILLAKAKAEAKEAVAVKE